MRISLVALFAIAMGLFSSGNANAAVLCSSADGRGVEVDHIWCNTERNYQNSGVTKCFAAQYNAPMNVRLYVRVGHSQFGQEFRYATRHRLPCLLVAGLRKACSAVRFRLAAREHSTSPS